MAKFNPAMLVPASQIEGFAKAPTQRPVQQVALDNIARMKEQFQAGDAAEGKRNFRLAGDRVAFTIRVNNTALVLVHTQGEGGAGEVRELAAPKASFLDALDYMADRVKAGEFDDQLLALSGKREARTAKMRSTRAAKKAGSKPA